MRASVEIVSGSQAGHRHVLMPGQSLRFGRTEMSEIVISEDVLLSRQHCEFKLDNAGFHVRDLGSQNGTFVNDFRTADAQLMDGDRVRIGNTVLKIHVLGSKAKYTIPDVSILHSPVKSDGPISTSQNGYLRIITGPDRNRCFVIQPFSSLSFGRTEEASVSIPVDPRMSHTHFEICGTEDVWQVRDLGSRNGTFLNDARVVSAPLKDGDEIRAGGTLFLFGKTEGSPVEEPPQTPSQAETIDLVVAPETHLAWQVVPEAVISASQVVFEITSENRRGRRFWLKPGQSLKFGRSERVDVPLPWDAKLSNAHFVVACKEDACEIRDLDSLNGTRLNGDPIRKAWLADGDTVLAGTTSFRVQLGTSLDSAKRDNRVRERPLPRITPSLTTHGTWLIPSFRREKCPTGLTCFVGEADSPADILLAIGRQANFYVSLDACEEGNLWNKELEEPRYLLKSIPPELLPAHSPVVVASFDHPDFCKWVTAGWLQGVAVFLFTQQSPAKACQLLQEMICRVRDRDGGEPAANGDELPAEGEHGILGVYVPKIIRQILTTGPNKLAAELMQNFEAIATPGMNPKEWRLFADEGFLQNLLESGLIAEPEPQATSS